VADSWLHGSVCRQIPEPGVRVGCMELCVERDLKCG